MADPADPWSIDYFNPVTPKVRAPAPRGPKTPRLIPEVHELFTVQRHALDVLYSIRELGAKLGDHDDKRVHAVLRTLERDAENTYRVIRSYLQTYAQDNSAL